MSARGRRQTEVAFALVAVFVAVLAAFGATAPAALEPAADEIDVDHGDATLPERVADRATMHDLLARAAQPSRDAVVAWRGYLEPSQSPLLAAQAIDALARLGEFGRRAADLTLLRDPRLRVRQQAVRALGASGDRSHVPALLETLATHSDLAPLVAHALGQLGGPAAEAALAELRASGDAVTAAFARQALRPR